jgi:hypothetical protein
MYFFSGETALVYVSLVIEELTPTFNVKAGRKRNSHW